ncbi:MAG: hypothetical protein NZM35_11770 [Chitinophagales bacterium]|nr:hypothetical protein [Chitinophagales bacterium]MDW8420064.1 hypothetical protein [Chitinophagales bacterium]
MKILKYFERAWIAAMVAAMIVTIYNLIVWKSVLDRHVYFPFFCGLFCLVIWQNLRGQRKFREKMLAQNKQPENPA